MTIDLLVGQTGQGTTRAAGFLGGVLQEIWKRTACLFGRTAAKEYDACLTE